MHDPGNLPPLTLADHARTATAQADLGRRPLAEGLRAANAAAALSGRTLDGRSAIPTAAELERFPA